MKTYGPTIDKNQALFNDLVTNLEKFFPEYQLVNEEGHWNCYFQNKINERKGFYLSVDTYRGKLSVSTRYYQNNKSTSETELYIDNKKVESISCGFSLDRPAEDIAKGIIKRFFPNFDKYFKLVLEKWNAENEYQNKKEQSLRDICEAIDSPIPTMHGSSKEIRYEFTPYDTRNLNVKNYIRDIYVSSGDSIEIKTNYLTREKALRLIEAIKNL